MTKRVAWTLLALAACLALPAAHAHGAGAAREIDTRVLADDDGLVSYGGCVETCAAPATGFDLLALDVREAWLGDQPAIVFRMLYQTDGSTAGRDLALDLESNGTAHKFVATSAEEGTFAATGFDLLQGPFDAFDGHPKALDGWVLLASLGVAPGAELSAITLTSHTGDQPDDVMPGGWYSNGAEVPHVPHDPDPGEALEEHGPGSYAVKGPAPLLFMSAAPILLDLARSGNVTVRLTNPLAATAQSVTVALAGGETAVFASGAREATLSLDPGATRDLEVKWAAGSPGGSVTVLATSDLGARVRQDVQAIAVPVLASDPTQTSGPAKDSPGLGAGALPALLVAVACAIGRRR